MKKLQIGNINVSIDTVSGTSPGLAVDFDQKGSFNSGQLRAADEILHIVEMALGQQNFNLGEVRAHRGQLHYEIRPRPGNSSEPGTAAVMEDIVYHALEHLSREVDRGVPIERAVADMKHHIQRTPEEEFILPPVSSDRLGRNDWVSLRGLRIRVEENLDQPVLEMHVLGESLVSPVKFEQAQKVMKVIGAALDEEGIQCEPIVLERPRRSYQIKLVDPKSGYTSKEMFETASRVLHRLHDEFDKPKSADEILDGMLAGFRFDPEKGPMQGEKGLESPLEARLRKAITDELAAFNRQGAKQIDDPALVDELIAVGLQGKFAGKPLHVGDAVLQPPEENNLHVLVEDKLARHFDRNEEKRLIQYLAGTLTEAIYNVRIPHRGVA